MNTQNKLTPFVLVILLAGCTQTVWVTEKKVVNNKEQFTEVGGIPFYIKKKVFDQSSQYGTAWLKSTLSIEKKLMVPKTDEPAFISLDKQSYEKQLCKSQLSDLHEIKNTIVRADELGGSDVNSLVLQYAMLDVCAGGLTAYTELLSNTVTARWVVDESETYYLNAPFPWFGSGNLTQELNADGTLSKVVSNPDSKLAESVAALIPFKEYLTGKFVDPLSADSSDQIAEVAAEAADVNKLLSFADLQAAKSTSKVVYVVSLSIEEVGHQLGT